MTSHRYDWVDLGFTGVVEVEWGLACWRILEIVSDEPIGWWPKDAPGAYPSATDPADAEVVVEIGVKSDGCANYSWDDGCCTHTCDGGKALAAMILRVHEVTAELLADGTETG